MLAALLANPAGRAAAQADSAAGRPPKALVDAGEHGEDLYDAATAGHWKAAARQLAALKLAVARLAPTVRSDAGKRERLQREIAALERSVAGRQRQATIVEANQVTLTVADLTEPFAPSVPVGITRLDYYGRELAIWSASGNDERLRAAARGTRHEWDRVRPVVAGRDSRVARQFEDLVTRVEGAGSHAEYGRLAKRLLDDVDELERVMGPSSP